MEYSPFLTQLIVAALVVGFLGFVGWQVWKRFERKRLEKKTGDDA